jgi:4-alpha-glucanotransferase
MTFARASGLLLHPTSLPGRFGVGDLGPAAHRFSDFLAANAQSLWQVLPLGPTGYGDSPYACYSAFAGNELLISPEGVFQAGLLSRSEFDDLPTLPPDKVDFARAHEIKQKVISQAFANYQATREAELKAAFESFADENAQWLNDYALFRALKDQHGGKSWHEWEPALAQREPTAIANAVLKLNHEIQGHTFAQFLFFKQWFDLKNYCHLRGLSLIGDVPSFVAHDSVDVWTNPEEFKLESDGRPTVVAGVPPDYFSSTGQLWGNPIYNWEHMTRNGFRWWIERVRANLRMVHILRFDHFRGFAACWEIPAGDPTAERGHWVDAPGRELFQSIKNALGELPIIAEDLGVITPEVEKLRDDLGLPGMRVLQFAFDGESENVHLPHNYEKNVVAYTATHDNDTTAGWFNNLAGSDSTRTADEIKSEREFCLKYLRSDGSEIHWDFIRAVMASVADTAIVPLQDVLGLGSDTRMNRPNSTAGNWSWRFAEESLTEQSVERLKEMTETYGRAPKKSGGNLEQSQ